MSFLGHNSRVNQRINLNNRIRAIRADLPETTHFLWRPYPNFNVLSGFSSGCRKRNIVWGSDHGGKGKARLSKGRIRVSVKVTGLINLGTLPRVLLQAVERIVTYRIE